MIFLGSRVLSNEEKHKILESISEMPHTLLTQPAQHPNHALIMGTSVACLLPLKPLPSSLGRCSWMFYNCLSFMFKISLTSDEMKMH